MGARAFQLIRLVRFLPGQIAIEIGSERGEGSTAWLSEYCNSLKVPFYTVDPVQRTPETIISTGEEWLAHVDDPIKFAYLDGFDFIFKGYENAPWIRGQKEEYEGLGLELNNQNSKQSHLTQAKLVHEHAAPYSLTIVDDTWYVDGGFDGKGGTAVPWLVKHGWKVINEVGDGIDSYVALRKET